MKMKRNSRDKHLLTYHRVNHYTKKYEYKGAGHMRFGVLFELYVGK